MNLILLSTLVVGASSLVDLCLPQTHEVHMNIRRDFSSDYDVGRRHPSHHHDEYYEGEFLHVWTDAVTKQSLVHTYERDWYNHQGETHHKFSLRNYMTKRHWRGNWNHTTQTVTGCTVEKMDRPWSLYCPLQKANKTGTGYVGMTSKVDFYSVRFDEPERKYFEDIHAIMEYGSTSLIMQERVFGEHFNETEQKLWRWVDHIEWFDLSEAAIPATTFAIPANCPNPRML